MLHIVTVATESKYYFPYLKQSCEKNGGQLEVIGYGKQWLGFNWKLKNMIEYLEKVPKKDVVCYVDGYDVICVRPLQGLREKYAEIQQKTGCKILVATEQNQQIWSYVASFFFGRCEGKILNAGTFIGYAEDLLQIVRQIYEMGGSDSADDQACMVQKCVLRPRDFHVDTSCEIFLTVVDTLRDIDDAVKAGPAEPWFVHAPMYGIMDNTIRRLGYDPGDELGKARIAEQYRRNILSNKLMTYLMIFMRMYFVAICLTLAVIAIILYYVGQRHFTREIHHSVKSNKT